MPIIAFPADERLGIRYSPSAFVEREAMGRLWIILFCVLAADARAETILNLNVFDELQGSWEPGFREARMNALADYIANANPDIVVFQEAKGLLPGAEKGGADSVDGVKLKEKYPFRHFVHEMTGHDGASYGYWIGSKTAPVKWIEDGFSFPGGVERKVQAAIWNSREGTSCFGVLSLHFSYQNSEVRQKEARWVIDWLKSRERDCGRWVVVGDFNADREDAEMKVLFANGLENLTSELKPTVGPFNPIRRIYGANIPSRTIDWALAWKIKGSSRVVLDTPWQDQWVSDHAAILINLDLKEDSK